MSGGTLHVIDAGLQTTVQDYPGRPGKLAEGYFPAGAMDHFGLRAANLLGRQSARRRGARDHARRSELHHESRRHDLPDRSRGPVSRRRGEQSSCGPRIESRPTPRSRSVSHAGPGFRQYLAVGGGIAVPELFGSRSTYTMGALGGHEGRQLQSGDELPLGDDNGASAGRRLASAARPDYARDWEIEAVRGPQASPDFLTENDMATLFERWWQVDRNSNRMGIRLESHKFEWARTTGGVAGGHPSNILDNPYAVGSVNINGDLPVILGPDGPTAGGFVVAATVAHGAMWKIGQLRPVGDRIRFREVSVDEAIELDKRLAGQLTQESIESA